MGLTSLKPKVWALPKGIPKGVTGANRLILAWMAFLGQDRLAEREGERSALQLQVAEVQRRLEQTEVHVPLAVVEDYCHNAQEGLQHGALEDIRALLRSIVVRVEVEPDGGRLIYSIPFIGGALESIPLGHLYIPSKKR